MPGFGALFKRRIVLRSFGRWLWIVESPRIVKKCIRVSKLWTLMMSENPALDWREFEVAETGTSGGHCDCCGTETKRVWGLVSRNQEAVAEYFIGWTRGEPEHGASFDLILGKWGEGATARDRYVVSLDFRVFEGAPQFMVVDAEDPDVNSSLAAESGLRRSDVIGTPLANQVFAILDAIYMSDSAEEISQWSTC